MSDKNREPLDQYDYVDDEYIEKVSPDYVKAIGLFLIQFSSLEHSINTSIADQINNRTHEIGYQVVELLSTRAKIDLLDRNLSLTLTYVNSKRKEEFKELVNLLRGLNTFRNKIVQANWMSLSKDGTVRTKITIDRGGGHVEFERTEMIPEIIFQKIEEMESLEEKIDEFLETYEHKEED